jgi:hypothetical protein
MDEIFQEAGTGAEAGKVFAVEGTVGASAWSSKQLSGTEVGGKNGGRRWAGGKRPSWPSLLSIAGCQAWD